MSGRATLVMGFPGARDIESRLRDEVAARPASMIATLSPVAGAAIGFSWRAAARPAVLAATFRLGAVRR
jgi:hypothetical protein